MFNTKPLATSRMYFIQVLRGVAAVAVVLYHIDKYTLNLGNLTNALQYYVPDIFGEFTRLFFAISGFVMAWLIYEKPTQSFFFQRLLRIYPAYWMAVVLAVFAYTAFLGSYVVSPSSFFRALTLLPFGLRQYPLRVEWTLVFEVFFYTICAIFSYPRLKKWYLPFLICWLGLIVVTNQRVNGIVPDGAEILLDPRNLSFIFGSLAYFLARIDMHPSAKKAGILFGVSMSIYFLGYYLFGNKVETLLFLKNIPGESARALLMSVCVYAAVHIPFNPQSFMVRLGDYSYAIYLVHAPILFIIYTLFLNHNVSLNGWAALIALVVILSLGWQYGRFETWLHQWLKNQHFTFTPRLQALVLLVVFMATGLHYTPTLRTFFAQQDTSIKASKSPELLDPKLIITDIPLGGIVDNISQSNNFLLGRGWAVDRNLNEPAQAIIITANGQIFPIQLTRLIRKDVAKHLHSSVANPDFGWQMQCDLSSLPPGKYLINIYAQTKQGKYHLVNQSPYGLVVKDNGFFDFSP